MQDYFAYGSNLDRAQMKRRCPGSVVRGRGVVPGYALTFPVHSDGDWLGGVASIEPAQGRTLEGVVYGVTEDDLASLDRYEAVAEGMYRRGRITVRLDDGSALDCVTYFANAGYNAPQPPSRKYLTTIVRGAASHGLSAGYLAELSATPTIDG